ncbi:MAG: hypothetical protein WEA09_05000 [Gemmatimonadota bacterium]
MTVLLLDHGRHASLVLPHGKLGAIRYSYGDWRYYALNRTGFRSGAAALLWPTQAALGRRVLGGDTAVEDIRRTVRVPTDSIYPIPVDAGLVSELLMELETLFGSGAMDVVHESAAFNLAFVPHPQSYSLFRNSNQMVARWLRVLGATTRGWPMISSWHLEAAGR